MKISCISTSLAVLLATGVGSATAFVERAPTGAAARRTQPPLLGWFDNNWSAGGSGKDRLDEEWQKQQEILSRRRKPKSERDAYFRQIEESRRAASKKQADKWAWQTKTYDKGEDPINEWKKRREDGSISDLENQYGDPKKIGGIPLPMASFGVGGEFGVGGKFDNGGRFDLRLPYADQGYVDEDADFMGKLFGKKKANTKKDSPSTGKKAADKKKPTKKQGGWPW